MDCEDRRRAAEREQFATVVGQAIRKLTFTPVDPGDFDLERVPPHLRMTFRAVDERGRVLGMSKDLGELQSRLAGQTREAVAKAVGGSAATGDASRGDAGGASRAPTASEARAAGFAERSGVTAWEWDEIPAHLDTRQAGNVIRAYPALIDEGT